MTEVGDFNCIKISQLKNDGLKIIIDSPHGLVTITHKNPESPVFVYTSPENPTESSRKSRSYLLSQDSTHTALSQLLATIYKALEGKRGRKAKKFQQLVVDHTNIRLL